MTEEPTLFSVYNPDDYKYCMCFNFGRGELDCPQANDVKCDWTPESEEAVDDLIEIDIKFFGGKSLFYIERSFESYDLEMPYCHDRITGQRRARDFLAIELVKDNEGLDDSS